MLWFIGAADKIFKNKETCRKLTFSSRCAKIAVIPPCWGCGQLPQTKPTLLCIRMTSWHCAVLFSISSIAGYHRSLEAESCGCWSLKILELLGRWVIIAKQGKTKYRWKVIPVVPQTDGLWNSIPGAVRHAWELVAHRAVAFKDAELPLNTTVPLQVLWLASFFSFRSLHLECIRC